MESIIGQALCIAAALQLAVSMLLIVLAATVCRKQIGHGLFGWHEYDENGVCKFCGQKFTDEQQE